MMAKGGFSMVFTQVLLPVIAVAGIGFLFSYFLQPDLKPFARLALYVLSPSLAFTSLSTTQVSLGDIAHIVLFALVLTAVLWLLTYGLGKLSGQDGAEQSAMMLTSIFMNCANYGLPVVLFFLGKQGFARAIILVVIEGFLMYTVGTFVAARGRNDLRESLVSVLKMPTMWASSIAFAVHELGWAVPQVISKPVGLLGQAAIPVTLLLLGMQLAQVEIDRSQSRRVILPSIIRLLISPLVALGIVSLLHTDPLTAKVLVLEAGMPSAVTATILAIEFDALPAVVSTGALITTGFSVATLSLIMYLMGS